MSLLSVFACGNLVPALVLGLGCYSLPLRWWGLDVPVSLAVVGLLATSAASLAKPSLAPQLLRGAAFGLLLLGLGLVAAFGLSVAFLAGVNGPFGAFGMILMGLVVLLLAPYTVLYPAVQLWWLGRVRAPSSGRRGEERAGGQDVAVGEPTHRETGKGS